MKQKVTLPILSIFIVLSLISSLALSAENCSDTDGGKEPYTKGTVTDAEGNFTDYCISGSILNEYYCTGVKAIVEEGKHINVTIGGENYTIELLTVYDPDYAKLEVNGVEYFGQRDVTFYAGSLEVTIETIIMATSGENYVTLSLGSKIQSDSKTYTCETGCYQGACGGPTENELPEIYTFEADKTRAEPQDVVWFSYEACDPDGTVVSAKAYVSGSSNPSYSKTGGDLCLWDTFYLRFDEGNYTVTLMVEDNNGSTASEELFIEIVRETGKYLPFIEYFAVYPPDLKVGERAKMEYKACDQDGDVPAVDIDLGPPWSMGTGTSSIEGNCIVVENNVSFKSPGTFVLNITATDKDGNRVKESEIVTVTEVLGTTCSDTDGGINYYSKGTAKDLKEQKTDYCDEDKMHLNEFYCEGQKLGVDEGVGEFSYHIDAAGRSYDLELVKVKSNSSAIISVDGVSKELNVNEETTISRLRVRLKSVSYVKKTGGAVKGHVFLDLGPKTKTAWDYYKCPDGCEEGACLGEPETCIDTDSGIKKYVKGSATDSTGTHYDSCISSDILKEHYCSGSRVSISGTDKHTVVVEGKAYVFEIISVSRETAEFEINGNAYTKSSGDSFVADGLDIRIDAVLDTVTGEDTVVFDVGPKIYLRTKEIYCENSCINGYCKQEEPLPTKTTVAYSLSKGWNLISTPFTAITLDEILENTACDFRKYKNEYVWYYKDGKWEHPSILVSKRGYYIYAGKFCSFELSGYTADFVSIHLTKGWNMISIPSETAIESILGDCQLLPFKGKEVWTYQSGWETYSISDALLEPTKGYFVYSKEECTLGRGGSPPIP